MSNRWGNNGNSGRLYFWEAPKSLKFRWWLQPWNSKMLAPWKKSYDQPRQHIEKQRLYFADKVHLVKAMVFPVVMYGCESWTVKKAECQRIDDFELWCWRRLLRVPWTTRRSSQSILKEISPEYSLEGLMLKLKLQYFGHLIWRTDSLEKTMMQKRLKAGEGDDGGWDWWMASLTRWTWVWTSSGRWWWTGSLTYCSPWSHKESHMTEELNRIRKSIEISTLGLA